MSLDVFDERATGEAPTTVWVQTANGMIETTMPRPPPGVGPAGPAGPPGAAGATGPGVAVGGATGQVLVKTSGADYATGWVDVARGVAARGTFTTGQFTIPVSTTQVLSPVLNWTPAAGRLYRISVRIRAVRLVSAPAGTIQQARLEVNHAGSTLIGSYWNYAASGYGGAYLDALLNGDGVARALTVSYVTSTGYSTELYTDANSAWWVEDVGKVP